MMNKEQRDNLRKLADAATKGPWVADGSKVNRIVWSSPDDRVCFLTSDGNGVENSDFIAASRSAIPALLDQIDQLERQNQDLVECNNRYLQRARDAEEVLRFYADEKNWHTDKDGNDATDIYFSMDIATEDMGKRARKALGEKA